MDNKTDQKLELDALQSRPNETSWGADPLSRDSREIGNKVVANSASSPKDEQDRVPEVSPDNLDQLNNFLPKSALEAPAKANDTKVIEEALDIPFDKNALRTTDKLDQTGVAVIDTAIEKLSQDGDIANFYDTARQMMEANLDNSYNRKIGEGIK